MENVFVVAAIISAIFFVAKFIENKFIDKETSKPIKTMVRDTLLVYFSVLFGDFIIQQFAPIMQKGGKNTPVFVDNPEF